MFYVIDTKNSEESYVYDSSDNTVELTKNTILYQLVSHYNISIRGVTSESVSVEIPSVLHHDMSNNTITFVISEVILSANKSVYNGRVYCYSESALELIMSMANSGKLTIAGNTKVVDIDEVRDNYRSHNGYVVPVKSVDTMLEAWLALNGLTIRYSPILRVLDFDAVESLYLRLESDRFVVQDNKHLMSKIQGHSIWSFYQNALRAGYVSV